MKIAFAFLYLITSFAMEQTPSSTRPLCTSNFAGSSVAEIQMRDRKISILGWIHPETTPDLSRLRESYQRAFRQAKSKNCKGAIKTLEKALREAADVEKNTQFVLSALNSIDARDRIDVVGAEISPEEWRIEQSFSIAASEITFNQILQLCPGQNEILKRFQTVNDGPDWAFVTQHKDRTPAPSLVPLESFEPRMEQIRTFDKKVTVDFDNPKSRHAKLPGFNEINTALWEERPPSEIAIQNLARAMGGPTAKNEAILKHDISVWKERVRVAYQRNTAIVRNIDEVKGHAALVIGHQHVKDLVKQFEAQCRQEDNTPLPIEASK